MPQHQFRLYWSENIYCLGHSNGSVSVWISNSCKAAVIKKEDNLSAEEKEFCLKYLNIPFSWKLICLLEKRGHEQQIDDQTQLESVIDFFFRFKRRSWVMVLVFHDPWKEQCWLHKQTKRKRRPWLFPPGRLNFVARNMVFVIKKTPLRKKKKKSVLYGITPIRIGRVRKQ